MFGMVSRVQVHGGDLLDDFKEPVGLFQLFDLFVELELLDDLPGAGGEPGHEVAEIGGELVGIAEERLEGELAGVVEGQLELLIDDLLDGLGVSSFLRLELLVHRDDVVLGLLQHAIETTQHGERNHHPAILRRPVRTAQEIGDVPDDITVLFECVEVFHEMGLSRVRASGSDQMG